MLSCKKRIIHSHGLRRVSPTNPQASPWEPSIHVPLIIAGATIAPHVEEHPVSLIDAPRAERSGFRVGRQSLPGEPAMVLGEWGSDPSGSASAFSSCVQ